MSTQSSHVLGVLGGMGPLATVAFLRSLIANTRAQRDQDHLRVLTWSDPTIPDRVASIVDGTGESPLPALVAGARRLADAGATFLAMPCNTAHYWYSEVAAAVAVPFLDLVDTVIDDLHGIQRRNGAPLRRVGILATRGTTQAQIFDSRLEGAGFQSMVPDEAIIAEALAPAIAAVKAHRLDVARRNLEAVWVHLGERRADAAILACTELSTLVEEVPRELVCVDAATSLACACLRHAGYPIR